MIFRGHSRAVRWESNHAGIARRLAGLGRPRHTTVPRLLSPVRIRSAVMGWRASRPVTDLQTAEFLLLRQKFARARMRDAPLR